MYKYRSYGISRCPSCSREFTDVMKLESHKGSCKVKHCIRSDSIMAMDIPEDELPSQKKLFNMVVQLGKQCLDLKEKVDHIHTSKKTRKQDYAATFQEMYRPMYTFDKLADTIDVFMDDAKNLLQADESVINFLNDIFSRSLYQYDPHTCPLKILQNFNVVTMYAFYEEGGWKQITNAELGKFLIRMHTKMYKAFYDLRKEKASEIKANKQLCMKYDVAFVKIMTVDFVAPRYICNMKDKMVAQMQQNASQFD